MLAEQIFEGSDIWRHFLKQLLSIFYTKYHMISNFIGTMACLFYLDHLHI